MQYMFRPGVLRELNASDIWQMTKLKKRIVWSKKFQHNLSNKNIPRSWNNIRVTGRPLSHLIFTEIVWQHQKIHPEKISWNTQKFIEARREKGIMSDWHPWRFQGQTCQTSCFQPSVGDFILLFDKVCLFVTQMWFCWWSKVTLLTFAQRQNYHPALLFSDSKLSSFVIEITIRPH